MKRDKNLTGTAGEHRELSGLQLIKLVTFLAFLIVFVSILSKEFAHATDDEEGPLLVSYSVSPSTNLNIGDKVTITLKMKDPGGSGIRNIQFCISDKFGRQHCADNYAELSSPQFVCPGTNVCDYPFVFTIGQTWGNNGYTQPAQFRAFDMKANGTYFYDDGKYQNLQSNSYYPGTHALAGFKLLIGIAPTPTPTPTPTPAPTPGLCIREGATVNVAGTRYTCVDTGVGLVFLTDSNAAPFLELKRVKIALEKVKNEANNQRASLFAEVKQAKDKSVRNEMLNQIKVWDEFLSRYSSKVPTGENLLAGETELAQLSQATKKLIALSKQYATITCVKANSAKKVTAINPKCPKGYKKK